MLEDSELEALPVEPRDAPVDPVTSGTRSAGPRLRATMASYRCAFALEQSDFESARLEYWLLQQALDQVIERAGDRVLDDELVALRGRARDLARMLALRITPREFKRVVAANDP
jgi:hypothetical protein